MKKNLLSSIFVCSLQATTLDKILLESLVEEESQKAKVAHCLTMPKKETSSLLQTKVFLDALNEQTVAILPAHLLEQYSKPSPLQLHGMADFLATGAGEKTNDLKVLLLDHAFGKTDEHYLNATVTTENSLFQLFETLYEAYNTKELPHGEMVSSIALQGLSCSADLRFVLDTEFDEKDFFAVNIATAVPNFPIFESFFQMLRRLHETESLLKVCSMGNLNGPFEIDSLCFPDAISHSLEKDMHQLYVVAMRANGLIDKSTSPGKNPILLNRTLAACSEVAYYNDDKEMHGTSFATPLVTQAATLLKGLFPELSSNNVADILLASAVRSISIHLKSLNIHLHIQEHGKEDLSHVNGITHIYLPYSSLTELYGQGILSFQNAEFLARWFLENKDRNLEKAREQLPKKIYENKSISRNEEEEILLFLNRIKGDPFIQEKVLPFLLQNHSFSRRTSERGLFLEDLINASTIEQDLTSRLSSAKQISELENLFEISQLYEFVLPESLKTEIQHKLWQSYIKTENPNYFSKAKILFSTSDHKYERIFNATFLRGIIRPFITLLDKHKNACGEITHLFIQYMKQDSLKFPENFLTKTDQDHFAIYALTSFLIDLLKIYKLEQKVSDVPAKKLSSSGRLMLKVLGFTIPKVRDSLLYKELEITTASEISEFIDNLTKDWKLVFGIEIPELGVALKFSLALLNQAFKEAKDSLKRESD